MRFKEAMRGNVLSPQVLGYKDIPKGKHSNTDPSSSFSKEAPNMLIVETCMGISCGFF